MRKPAYILSVSNMFSQKYFCIRKMILLLTAAAGCVICLSYASECTDGVRKGMLFCIEVLMPSLYLFMALSAFIVRSGVIDILTKPLSGISRFLFRLPPAGTGVILLSMIGGYPVGARCAATLYEQGSLSEKEAQKTACIAVCAGPGFLINYIGIALLNNRRAGVILMCAAYTGVLMTGVILGRVMKKDATPVREKKKGSRACAHDLLITSVADASRSAFHMCGMVVVCVAMIEIVSAVSPDKALTDILSACIEITAGCQRMCGSYPLPLIAFFIGFGGIAVHLQIFAGLGKLVVNKGVFFLSRIIQGIITAAAAYIYLMILPVEQSVFSSTDAPLTLSKSATLAGSAALVLCSLCFLGSIRSNWR